jgi:hypothetical protein
MEDISKFKDSELENKISELSRKYFMTSNSNVQHQISLILESYKIELRSRREKNIIEEYQKRDRDLDNLINVN